MDKELRKLILKHFENLSNFMKFYYKKERRFRKTMPRHIGQALYCSDLDKAIKKLRGDDKNEI